MIRLGHPEDFPLIDEFDPFAGDRDLEISEGRLIVFEREKLLAGYLSWLPEGFVGRDYITFVCVHPDFRRQGIASKLLRDIEARIGTGRLFVSTEIDNEAMLSLLADKGWTNAGEIAGANEGDRAEVFFFKDLSPPA